MIILSHINGGTIDRDHNLFQVEPTENNRHITYCISQSRWNKGKHDMVIRILNHSHNQHGLSIGILTNHAAITSGWLFDSPKAGVSYQFYFGCICDRNQSGIYHFNNGKGKCLQNIDGHKGKKVKDDMMNNKEFKLTLNCDEWNISFYFDDKQLGHTIDIDADNNYYAAIVYNTDSFYVVTNKDNTDKVPLTSEYELVMHTRSAI